MDLRLHMHKFGDGVSLLEPADASVFRRGNKNTVTQGKLRLSR